MREAEDRTFWRGLYSAVDCNELMMMIGYGNDVSYNTEMGTGAPWHRYVDQIKSTNINSASYSC